MLSQIASWMVEPHDAGEVDKPSHRKAILIGCGAVIVIGAASYTVYKYRHGINGFFNRLYASTSQYMRVCLHTDKSDSAAPDPSSSQDEMNKETGENDNAATGENDDAATGENDNAATGEAQRNASGDEAVADIEGAGSDIPPILVGRPIQVEELLRDGLLADETRDLMHGGYFLQTDDFLRTDDFLTDSFQQVDGGDAMQALNDASLSIDGGTAEENDAQAPKRG